MVDNPPKPDQPVDPTLLSSTIYHSLHQLAARQLRDQRAHSLQPTMLVHEAWLRIAKLHDVRGEKRAQFFALAGKAMRSVVIDCARRRLSGKRGGGGRIDGLEPDTLGGDAGAPAADLLALDEALGRLAAVDPAGVEVVELMFFAGKTAAEVAEVLGTSSRTIERRWRFARAFLRDAMGDGPAAG